MSNPTNESSTLPGQAGDDYGSSPLSPDMKEDRKKRVEQLKAKMEGLKRGISLGEKESAYPDPGDRIGGSEIIAVKRPEEGEASSSEPYPTDTPTQQDGNSNGHVDAKPSTESKPPLQKSISTPMSRIVSMPPGKITSPSLSKRTTTADPPSLYNGPVPKKERNNSFSLEPTQDLLSRLIEIQALLTNYALEFDAEEEPGVAPESIGDGDHPPGEPHRMVAVWKPKFDEVLELVSSSIEFFRDHEVIAIKDAEEHKDNKPKETKEVLTKVKTAPKPPERKPAPNKKVEPEIKRKDDAPKVRPLPPTRQKRRPSIVLTQRSRIENEIFETEATFVSQLKILIENYLVPLRESKLADPEKLLTIFSNVEILHQYNTHILEVLEKVVIEGDTATSIGKIFLEMAPFLKVYTDYIAGAEKATQCFAQCMKSTAFSNFINDCHSKLNSNSDQVAADVPSLLIAPVQRIPRYVLLLQELLKYTPSEHSDFEHISQALNKIKEVADHLNNSQKQSNTLKKVLEIQASIDGDYLNLVEPHRTFAKEGVMMAMWIKPETAELPEGWGSGAIGSEFMFFLFNDLLLYAVSKKKLGMRGGKVVYDYKGFFLLFNANVIDVPDKGDTINTIELVYKEDPQINASASTRYLLRARSAEEKKDWLHGLNTQIASARSAISTSKIDLFKATSKQGYLFKRGENRKNWKRRYFRLKGDSLFYYENAKETTPIGAVFLPDYSLHMAEERMKRPFCFELRHLEKRCYFLQGDCVEAVTEWATAFYQPIAWIDSDIANKYLDRDVVKNNREEKILSSETSEKLTRRPAVFGAFRNDTVRKITSFRTPNELAKERGAQPIHSFLDTRPSTTAPGPGQSTASTGNNTPSTTSPASAVQPPPGQSFRTVVRKDLIGHRERGAAPVAKEN